MFLVLVIISNQAGISLKRDPKTLKGDMKRLSAFKEKVGAVLTQLDIPMNVYAATAQDQFRKPRSGMWQQMLEDYELVEGDSVDLAGSFYVGDAAGRGKSSGVRTDHACSDRYVE